MQENPHVHTTILSVTNRWIFWIGFIFWYRGAQRTHNIKGALYRQSAHRCAVIECLENRNLTRTPVVVRVLFQDF